MFAYRAKELLAGSASTSRVNHKNKLLLIMATIERDSGNVKDADRLGLGQFIFPQVGRLPISFHVHKITLWISQ